MRSQDGRPLAGRAHPPRQDQAGLSAAAAAKTLLITLLGFKLFVAILIVVAQPSTSSVALVVFFNWPWLAAACALIATPLLLWYRLLRVRARRATLLRQEWRLDEASGARGP